MITFTAEYLASVAGVTTSDLLKMHPEDFGSPGHYRMQGAKVIYTERGARALADEFALAGCHTSAALLRALADNAGGPMEAATVSHEPRNWVLDWERGHES